MPDYPPALSHGPITEFVGDVFWVQGTAQLAPGMRLTRNMTIIRSGGDLTLVSAVRLSPEGEAELTKLGTVRNVVKIGHAHGMDDAYYLDRFGADYWALPSGARPSDPSPDKELGPNNLPIKDAELFEFRETIEKEGALLIQRAGGILVTCDSVQHWANTKGSSPMARIFIHLAGFCRRAAQIGPLWRKHQTPKGTTLQSDFERLVGLEFSHLIGGHGQPLSGNAKQALVATVKATF